MNGIQIEIPRETIEQIAREVIEKSLAEVQPKFRDKEAEEISRTLQRINAKQFISIPEFCFLFNCSIGYTGKLLELAEARATEHPIPYVNLGGLIQFDRLAVIEWATKAKPLAKGQRKTGGKKSPRLRAIRR